MKSICLYFQVHQPFRLRTYRFFDIGDKHNYYDDYQNRFIMKRVAALSYVPVNKLLLSLIEKHKGAFKVSFSISGMALEQFEKYTPEVITSFQQLAATGCVEFCAETYSHSLVALIDKDEFKRQVDKHADRIFSLFNQKPTCFRNTELIYSNEIGKMAYDIGYHTVLTEGAKHILGWKSPNFIYKNCIQEEQKILLRNFPLSDDIAFRFSNQGWEEWPLTAQKYAKWLLTSGKDCDVVNLFMDYETFGEHQKEDSGILQFLYELPEAVFAQTPFSFSLLSEASQQHKAIDTLDVHHPISWADAERDLTAWLGNELQDEAYSKLYALAEKMKTCNNEETIADWERLQSSDHFYYMCTKWFSDGDVHKYFNPYASPYDAFINYMNVLSDFQLQVAKCTTTCNEKDAATKESEDDNKKNSDAERLKAIFDEVHTMSKTRLQKLLREIDAEQLAIALNKAEKETVEFVTEHMGKRARATYLKKAEAVTKNTTKEIKTATKSILSKIKEVLDN